MNPRLYGMQAEGERHAPQHTKRKSHGPAKAGSIYCPPCFSLRCRAFRMPFLTLFAGRLASLWSF